MGFGHRVYKNFDPRAQARQGERRRGARRPRRAATRCSTSRKELEQVALADDYFIERKLYPNVDFYTGVIYKAMGFPTRMFTVLFAIGRLPGWIAHWREVNTDPRTKIGRPQQLYIGAPRATGRPAELRPASRDARAASRGRRVGRASPSRPRRPDAGDVVDGERSRARLASGERRSGRASRRWRRRGCTGCAGRSPPPILRPRWTRSRSGGLAWTVGEAGSPSAGQPSRSCTRRDQQQPPATARSSRRELRSGVQAAFSATPSPARGTSTARCELRRNSSRHAGELDGLHGARLPPESRVTLVPAVT